MTQQDEVYMRRAIALAKKGVGYTNPNPMVGAVVVKDGRIIAQGYHERCGDFHAERNALNHCAEDPRGGTIYVTLEPCCHFGRTPPCTDIIIEKKLARVVIGSRDPNPKVSGKGAAILRAAGIEVAEDFLKDECDELNYVFFHYITTGLPYVVMKYAMTLDGKTATRTGDSKWITGETAREHVHTLRGKYAAVMAGIGTVLADDPMLNCRTEGGHSPTRVICDSSLRIPLESQICKTAKTYPTVVVCAQNNNEKRAALKKLGITVLELPDEHGRVDLWRLTQELGKMQLDSVLIEGGGTLCESALKVGIVNHVCAYIAPKLFGGHSAKTPVEGEGVALVRECAVLGGGKVTPLGNDFLLEYDMVGGMDGVYRNC